MVLRRLTMTFANSRDYHEHVKVYSGGHEFIGNATFVGRGVQEWIGGRGGGDKILGRWSWEGTLMDIDFKAGEVQNARVLCTYIDGVPPDRVIISGQGMPPRIATED